MVGAQGGRHNSEEDSRRENCHDKLFNQPLVDKSGAALPACPVDKRVFIFCCFFTFPFVDKLFCDSMLCVGKWCTVYLSNGFLLQSL